MGNAHVLCQCYPILNSSCTQIDLSSVEAGLLLQLPQKKQRPYLLNNELASFLLLAHCKRQHTCGHAGRGSPETACCCIYREMGVISQQAGQI